MRTQGVFSKLVQQDLKWGTRKRRSDGKSSMSRGWRLAYVILGIITASLFGTYVALQDNFRLAYTWYLTFWLPFIALGFSISTVGREWKNGTIGWWLSLPFPRSQLIAAKFFASLGKTVVIFTGVYAVLALFAFYTVILSAHIGMDDVREFLSTGLTWFVVLAALTPFVAGFGILTGVVSHSRVTPALPLLWIAFWVAGNLILSRWIPANIDSAGALVPEFSGTVLLISIAASWIGAWAMVRVSSYVLERQPAL